MTHQLKRLVSGIFLGMLMTVLAVTTAQAQAAPWPMFHGNPQHTGLSPYSTAANTGTLHCFVNLPKGYSNPIVGQGGTVYLISTELDAVNPADCSVIWSYPLDAGDYSTVTPSQDTGGNIYFSTQNGYLYSIASTGTLNWTLSNQPAFDSDVIPVAGILYTGDSHGNLNALNAADGSTFWSNTIDSLNYAIPSLKGAKVYTSLYNPPTSRPFATFKVSTGQTIRQYRVSHSASYEFAPAIDSSGAVYLVNISGYLEKLNSGLVWKTSIISTHSRHTLDYWSSPALGPTGAVYIGTQDNTVCAIDAATGAQLWSLDLSVAHTSPAVGSDGTIFMGSGSQLWAINPDGTIKWTFQADQAAISSPAIDANGMVWFSTALGTLYSVQ